MQKIATLITCHNRRDNTIACLQALYSQALPEGTLLNVYLVDDGSSDLTSETVAEMFPLVQVIRGDGSLYWCGGMRLAWQTAIPNDGYDYFLWLNDDSLLKPGAITELLKTAQNHSGIIVGSCHDLNTGAWTYGGRATPNSGKSLSGSPVIPSEQVQQCQQVNGNVVLVPKMVIDKIGILSEHFTHAIGDFDYGFRALDAGISIYIAPHYQATCSTNPPPTWCSSTTPLLKRLALLNSPKGINFSEFIIFCRRHFGVRAYFIGLKVLLRVLIPSLWLHKKDVKP